MSASFRAELFKLRKRPAIWVLVAVGPMLLLFFQYFVPYTELKSGGIVTDAKVEFFLPAELVRKVVGIIPLFGTAIGVVLGALVAGSEYALSTLRTPLTQGPRRLAVYVGQLMALAVVLGAIVLILYGASAAASVVIAILENRLGDWPTLLELVGGVGAAWLILAVGASFGLLLAHAFRNPGLSIGVALIWLSVLEVLIGSLAEQAKLWVPVTRALLLPNTGSITSLFEPAGSDVVFPVSGEQAVVVLAAYVMVFSMIAAVLVRGRDVM